MRKHLLDEDMDNETFLRVGQKAPDFSLKTDKGEDWRLSDYRGRVVALLFYPKDETLVCTKQMCSLRNHWVDYLETKAEIVGVSPGTVKDHREFSKRHNLPLSLLADEEREITNRYSYHWIFPTVFMRSIVVIDAEGIIRTRRAMLRAFRPSDRSVISAIYEARADALQEQYKSILRKRKK